MKKRTVLLAALALFAALAWAGFSRLSHPPIAIVSPERGPAVQAVYATGTVEATVMMPIASRMTARLMELNADEGAEVKKDQQLAQLEDADVKGSLSQLTAREQFARDDYERKAALVKRGYESKSVADQAKTEWDAAKAAVSRAQAEANFMKLVAPADGLVIKRDGEVGQMIPANQPVFWLSCCAPLRISAEVDEEDISQVKNGQDVLIRADAFPGQTYKGRVQSITPKGDPVARSYRVRVEFAEETPLKIGMTAETNIIVGENKDALLLPSSAVLQNKVWLVKDGRLAEQTVTLGAKNEAKTEIKGGIESDALVVLNPSPAMKEGERVRTSLISQP